MNDTIKISMDMPRPPEGWRYKGQETGEAECRLPKEGEWYLFMSEYGLPVARKASYDHFCNLSPIIERVPWEPKVGEIVFTPNQEGDVFKWVYAEHIRTDFLFRTNCDAEKYITETRALADRIRAESEVDND